MNAIARIMLAAVGVIHLLPLSGVVGAGQLQKLYGLPFDDPNLEIMMRHRAVLFGLLGAFLIYAAINGQHFGLAMTAAAVSTLSFIWLTIAVGGYNAAVARVVIADAIAIACLIVALVAEWFQPGRR